MSAGHGAAGEGVAASALEAEGYRILERNWRSGRSEIDLIAQRGDIIAFVEVKTRGEHALAAPEVEAQRRRIALAAVEYLRARGIYKPRGPCSGFDVFEIVTGGPDGACVTRFFASCKRIRYGDLDVFSLTCTAIQSPA